MYKPAFTLFVFLFVTTFTFSQNGNNVYYKELTIITENDNYNFTKADRYYSNGLFVKYQWLAKNKQPEKLAVKLHRIEAGQMIFNPYLNRRSLEQVLEKQDRPYAGWLYGSYGQSNVYKNNRVLQWDVVTGTVGPAAAGKAVQTNYHKLIGLYKIYGWENQVQNEFGLNASVRYYHPLAVAKNVSLHAAGKAMLGNTFTNASAGLLFKAGKMDAETETAYWTSRLGRSAKQNNHRTEFIFFLEPMLMAQAYNATVQGPLLSDHKGSYTSAINPFIYIVKTGFSISGPVIGFSTYYHFKQREAKTMADPQEVYGAFALSFRFR
nr:lipid A deacylase LpxR family protein [uncultured Lacibacter sp.]